VSCRLLSTDDDDDDGINMKSGQTFQSPRTMNYNRPYLNKSPVDKEAQPDSYLKVTWLGYIVLQIPSSLNNMNEMYLKSYG